MSGFEQSGLLEMCKGMLQACAVVASVSRQMRLPEQLGRLRVLHVSRFELIPQDFYLPG